MSVTPLVSSPARIARWIGAAPRQRGRSEAWTLMQPSLRRVEDGLGQDQPIGCDHSEIGVQPAEPRLLSVVPQRLRRPHLDPELLRPLVHRRLPLRLAASRRPRRLRVDRDDVMSRLDQRVEARHREFRRSHEDDAHRRAYGERAIVDRAGLLRRALVEWQAPIVMRAKRHRWPVRKSKHCRQALARLPGPRPALGAARGAVPDEEARDRAPAAGRARFENVAEKLSTCSVCGNVDTSDPCSICRDPKRDDKMLCVVEEVADLWALDRSRLFPGRYHVLGGRLSALEGVRPEDLTHRHSW